MSRLSTPSSHQEAIFRFVEEGTGHGVIMATAGSGKSTTLIEVAQRLPEGTRACFLAFNTSAAQQLKDRLPSHVTARTVHSLGLKTLASAVKGRKLARVYPRKYQELVKARLRNTEESYRVSSQTASQAVHYLRELTHYTRFNLSRETDRGVLERLARTYHLRPPGHPRAGRRSARPALGDSTRRCNTCARGALRLYGHDLCARSGGPLPYPALRHGVRR